MKLITHDLFNELYRPQGDLKIGEFAAENFAGAAYYFRLGALDEGTYVVPVSDKGLTIEARGFVRVYSLESFHLSGRVLAHFGATSSLIGVGIELVHAPFIDPGFGGILQVGLRNNLDHSVNLGKHEIIGKALFFDVSDSGIDVDEFLNSVLKKDELHRRETAETELRELLGEADSESDL